MVYAFFATRIRPQKHYLPKTFFSPKNTLQSSKAPYCRCQYGLLSPYFAALNTGFCRPISLRSIRAFVALFRCAQYGLLLRYCPHSGAMRSAAPAMCSPLRRLRAYAYATRPYCRWQYGLPSPYLARWAQYGLLSPYFAALNTGSCYAIAPRGAMRSAAPAMCSPLRRLRAYAYATRPYCRWQYGLLSPYFAALNTGFCRPISLRSIRALATLLPLSGGQYAPPLRLCARRSAACAHTPTQPARIAVGNTGQSNTIHPIHIKMII